MEEDALRAAAAWLAEAFETGNPLAQLPPEATPGSLAEGEAVAEAMLDALGMAPCGLRLGPGPGGRPVAGPMLETRLARDGTAFALATLRHPRVSAAVVGILAEALEPGATTPPVLAALHPALDIADWRFSLAPATAALAAADLGGLGHVVVGRRMPPPPDPVPVALAPARRRPRGEATDLGARLAVAAAEARRLGGLPAGALLVVAGLTAGVAPEAGQPLAASFGPLGRAKAAFA